jgi:hypothetical protein
LLSAGSQAVDGLEGVSVGRLEGITPVRSAAEGDEGEDQRDRDQIGRAEVGQAG